MRTLTCLALVCLWTCHAVAEPEIKGSAPELTQFLAGVPKTAAITAEAEVRVPAHRAVLSLRITTEHKSLQEALRYNNEVRGKLSERLKGLGISADRIQASRFSSTPKYGMFAEKAKSYRVENQVRITVNDDKEFQSAAGMVDLWSEVQYTGVEFEYTDRDASKQKALSQACDNANERRKMYEEKFGVKLTPVRFNEGDIAQMELGRDYSGSSYGSRAANEAPAAPATRPYSSMTSSEGSASSFGELVYTARVTVECSVQSK